MGWILIILIWIVAPFAELGIIIALAIVNSRRKVQNDEWLKQIKCLNRELYDMRNRPVPQAAAPAKLAEPETVKPETIEPGMEEDEKAAPETEEAEKAELDPEGQKAEIGLPVEAVRKPACRPFIKFRRPIVSPGLYQGMAALISRVGIGEQAAASIAVMLLAAAVGQWSRRYPELRKGIPYILVFLAVTFRTICVRALAFQPEPDLVMGLYILAVSVWDVRKRDRFCQSILIIGTAAQGLFWLLNTSPFPIALLLAAYLFVKKEQAGEREKPRFVKGGCLYLLTGVYLLSGQWIDNGVLKMGLVLLTYAAAYLCANKKEDMLRTELFLAEGTVRNNISRLLEKLAMKDRTQLAVFAVKNDLDE